MSDAYTEFLTENAQREYPFTEDTFVDGPNPIPMDAILDIRGFHRAHPENRPGLMAVVGPSAPADLTYPTVAGYWAFYFHAGVFLDPVVMVVLVPAEQLQWPYLTSAIAPDPLYPDCPMGIIYVTFGKGVLNFSASDRITILEGYQIEPSIFAELYRNQVDSLKLVHAEGDPEYVGGDVILRSGYNTQVIQDATESIIDINAAPGAGPLGRFVGASLDDDESECKDRVLSINGVAGDPAGNFSITGGPGIEIINLPEENKIQIQISRATMATPTCS